MSYITKQLSITVKTDAQTTDASDKQQKFMRTTMRSYMKQVKTYEAGKLQTKVLRISWNKRNNKLTVTITKLSTGAVLTGKYEFAVEPKPVVKTKPVVKRGL